MLYILHGEDDFSQNEFLRELKKGLGADAVASTALLEGESLNPDELRAVVATLPFLAEKRLVVVKGLLWRFQAGSRADATRPRKAGNEAGIGQAFAGVINGIPPSTILVLVESELKDDNSLFAAIKTNAKILSYPSLKGMRLRAWIEQGVKDRGGSISAAAKELLARLVGSNLWSLSGEIEKLVLFTSGRQIETSDVSLLVSDARETSVFTLIDSLLEGNLESAAALLEKLLRDGETPSHILYLIARQLQFIVRASDLIAEGKSRPEVQGKLGIPDFAWQKTLTQVNRYGFNQIRDFYEKLLATDLAIKTGRYEEELALNLLVAEICER
ncbi:MAG: DNA polymerase III subunit delta [Chloroflexota bacterium]